MIGRNKFIEQQDLSRVAVKDCANKLIGDGNYAYASGYMTVIIEDLMMDLTQKRRDFHLNKLRDIAEKHAVDQIMKNA